MASKQESKVIAAALESGDNVYIEQLAESYYYGRGKEKSLKAALQLWEKASELGNQDALYYLGVCYYYGDGLPRNKEAAFFMWEQAAERGHNGAKISLNNLRGRE